MDLNRMRPAIVAGLFVFLFFAVALRVFANPPVEPVETCSDGECIERGVLQLIGEHRNPMQIDLSRKRFVEAVETAADEHGVPALLLTAMAFREGSFRGSVVGALGERSTWQVHGVAARGCNLSDYDGAADCAARWLYTCFEKCQEKSWTHAVTAYASGSCTPRTPRTAAVVRDRINLWSYLEALKTQ